MREPHLSEPPRARTRRRISEATAREVRQLLADGVSQRNVVRQVGVSRNSVQRIATGRWAPKAHANPREATLTARRCSGCGALAAFSGPVCVACAARGRRDTELEQPVDWERTEPTPNEIRAACLNIQAGWSEEERARRLRGEVDDE
jgi:hypothetical protein